MRRLGFIFIVLGLCPLVAGCAESADSFFSGRPSGMAMVHNRIIDGPPEAMVELLRVPSRFQGAAQQHVAEWQGSLVAWWRSPEKHQLLLASFRKLSPEESRALLAWVRTRGEAAGQDRTPVLKEIEAAIQASRRSS